VPSKRNFCHLCRANVSKAGFRLVSISESNLKKAEPSEEALAVVRKLVLYKATVGLRCQTAYEDIPNTLSATVYLFNDERR
jgi:hypothetical protein